MKFKEACEKVGYDPLWFKPPEKVYKYLAYKDGQCYECGGKEEAEKVSHNTERVLVNGDEIKKYLLDRIALEMKAVKLWEATLRGEYSEVTDDIYATCYEKAYAQSHQNGYDSVAETLANELELVAETSTKAVET